jgi:Na+/H+ antiporter
MSAVEPLLLLALGVTFASLLSRRTGLPAPVLLVVGGLAVALVPGHHTIALDPEIILTLVIPPLLYAATLESSLSDLRAARRGIFSLAVGLVAATSLAVGLVAHLLVPGLPPAAALALGAIVAPTDAVAAIAIGRRLGMPRRLAVIVEGEGMLNDAAGLTIYRLAVAALVTGSFSVRHGVEQFLLASVGGIAVGAAAAALLWWVRVRVEDALADNTLSLLTPFAVYFAAEELHASGVLAVVVTGLLLAHAGPRMLSGTSRLQTRAVWRLVSFLVEGGVFALIGLQLPTVVQGLEVYAARDLVGWSVAVVATVVLIRPLWVFATGSGVPLLLRGHAAPWRVSAAASWAGMRGVISLAMAGALPLQLADGRPFPHRDLLIFLTFVVICVTLLGQGLSFGVVLRRLGLAADRQQLLLEQANAQQQAGAAALARLDEIATRDGVEAHVAEQLRELTSHRSNAAWERLGEMRPGDETPSAAFRRLRAAMVEAERSVLVEMRDSGRLSDESLRELQRRLDFEEAQLHR